MSFLTGDVDADGSGEIEVDEAEAAAAEAADSIAELMDSDGNRQIEAEVEEQVFDGLTEEEAAKKSERAAARKETREPAKAAKK